MRALNSVQATQELSSLDGNPPSESFFKAMETSRFTSVVTMAVLVVKGFVNVSDTIYWQPWLFDFIAIILGAILVELVFQVIWNIWKRRWKRLVASIAIAIFGAFSITLFDFDHFRAIQAVRNHKPELMNWVQKAEKLPGKGVVGEVHLGPTDLIESDRLTYQIERSTRNYFFALGRDGNSEYGVVWSSAYSPPIHFGFDRKRYHQIEGNWFYYWRRVL